MRLNLVLLTIGIASVSTIYAQESHGNRSNENEAPVYSYIYEIKDERDGDARGQARSPDSIYARPDTDNRPAVTTADYSSDHDKVDGNLSNESSNQNEPLTIELIDSNESEDVSQDKTLVRLIQPYIVNLESQELIEDRSYEDSSLELQRTARTSQNYNKSSSENISSDSEESILENSSDSSYVESFGARVRNGTPSRDVSIRNSVRNKTKSAEELTDSTSSPKKKVFNPSNKIQSRQNVYRGSHNARKNIEAQKLLNEDREHQIDNKENVINVKSLKTKSIEQNYSTEKPNTERTYAPVTASTTGMPSKFSKPIVVPDIPEHNTYLFPGSSESPNDNNIKSTPRTTLLPREGEKESKSRVVEFNYLHLSPLQAGLTLLRSSDVNNDYGTSKNEEVEGKGETTLPYIQQSNEDALIDENDPETDQVLEQQQISDSVTQKIPAHPVEIQKSVEIYHTAPVHEIHYPVEFVPNVQKAPRERRPSQVNFNIYKSNEILDEKIVQSSSRPISESYHYEYNGESDTKKVPVTKANFVNEEPLNQASSLYSSQDQYPDNVYEQYTPQRTKLISNSDQDEQYQPIQEYNFEFQKLIPPLINSEQSTKLNTLFENPNKAEGIENTDQIRKVPQYLVPVGQYPIEKIVEKTVHIPHPISIEKFVEKKVPYPVEKVIEKQVMVPHPIPIHIQVPVDRVVEKQIRVPHIYPIHIEKVIEKKVPYSRLVVQPYPVHINVPQLPQEKVHIPHRSYLVEVEKSNERTRPYQVEVPKFVKVIPGLYPAHVQYEKTHQSLPRGQEKSHYQSAGTYRTQLDDNQSNSSQYSEQVYNNGYNTPGHQILLARQPVNQLLSRKYIYGAYYPPYTPLTGSQSYRRRGSFVVGEKEKDYVAPGAHQSQGTYVPVKNLQYSSIEAQNNNGASVVSSRRARQESSQGNTGSFRQSKMEYGFKPPMVPSVQYDEKTASKVE